MFNIAVRIIYIILGVSFLFACSPNIIKRQPLEIDRNIFQVVYKDTTIGTAFLYTFRGIKYVLTAAHTLEGLEEEIKYIKIKNKNSVLNLKYMVKPNSKYDFMIMYFSDYKDIDSFPVLEGVDNIRDIAYNDSVVVFNYSNIRRRIDKQIISRGYILDNVPKQYKKYNLSNNLNFDTFVIYLNILNKGGSGAPVILEKNKKVIGIVIERIIDVIDAKNERYVGVANVLSIQTINKVLDSYSHHP